MLSDRLHSVFHNTLFLPSLQQGSLSVAVVTDQEDVHAEYEACFLLKCKEPKSPLFREGNPYAEIVSKLTYTLGANTEEMQWHWKVTEILRSS